MTNLVMLPLSREQVDSMAVDLADLISAVIWVIFSATFSAVCLAADQEAEPGSKTVLHRVHMCVQEFMLLLKKQFLVHQGK